MIDSNTVLYIIYILGAYTLFQTYQNDFNVFLLTLLLMLGAFWCYLYINEVIDKWQNKIENAEKMIGGKMDFLIHNLFGIKGGIQQTMEEVIQPKINMIGQKMNMVGQKMNMVQ
jgi:hypothetical protein